MAFDFSRWSLARLFGSRSQDTGRPDERPVNPFHAVSIKCGTPACSAARSLGDTRYLSREAPRLPLPGCQLDTCTCRYRHHDDRRRRMRRRGDDGDPVASWPGTERRRGRGRRATDLEAAQP